jgi:tetratricopeptide (TPR) repeat protein
MMKSLPVVVAVFLFPLAASAQSQPSSDDIELARSLSQKGWFDLAEEICEQIQKSGSGPNKVMVPYVLAEILLNKADREDDFGKADQGLTDAVTNFKKFLEANPQHALALEARVSVGWVAARKGRLNVDQLGKESVPEKHAEFQKKAHAAYGDAETFYKQTITELKAAKQTPQVLDSLMDARLELPRVMVEHAKVPNVDEAQRKRLLQDALALFVDFEFDYGDRPIAFEAMLEEGKCLTELADFKQAESRLKATASLRLRLAEAKIKPNEYHNKIIYGSYIALAQMFIKASKYPEAKTFIDQVFKDDRSIEREWAGPALKLEKADALFRLKDSAGATALANEIIKQDPAGRWGYFARLKIKTWSELGGGVKMSPEQLMSAADASLSRDNFRDALINLRKCIENCQSDAEKQKWAADAYYKMGVSYQDLKRYPEAVVAFENMFTLFPNHLSAAKACYECVRCYIEEFKITGDKREDELKDKYLGILAQKWPKDPAARNIKFVQAAKVEAAGDLKKAAELYMQVGEDAEAYESALVAAGYCLHVDGAKKWEKAAKDPAIQAEVKGEFKQAEDSLRKFLKRLADPSTAPTQENLQKSRASLALVANQELAYILMHDAVGKIEESLKFLEQVAKDIPPEDDRMAKIWGTQIQAYLAQKQVDKAVKILDMMFEKFQDSAATARSCKSVAIKLDEATAELTKSKGDPALINENLRKISKYYAKWLQLAPALNMRITMQDVVSVAETLYMIAKQMNGLDENTVSFMDLNGKTITDRQFFVDAAYVLSLVADGKLGKISARDQITLMTRLARCYSFTATDGPGWEKAKDAYESLIKTFKVLDARQQLDGQVLTAHPELLSVYIEEGYVYYELGKKGNKFQFDNATTVFGNAQRMVSPAMATSWQCKYMVIAVLFERGKESDIRDAKVLFDNLERNNPDFDAGKFGMKDKFLELKKKLAQVGGK